MNEHLKKYLYIYYKAQELYSNGDNSQKIQSIVLLNFDNLMLSQIIDLLKRDSIRELLDSFDGHNI